jgi:Mg2+ and Co2+ transporter CorA
MKTLALLGSFFLPGTFLSSIFGMSFFDFSDGRHYEIPVQAIRLPLRDAN